MQVCTIYIMILCFFGLLTGTDPDHELGGLGGGLLSPCGFSSFCNFFFYI